MLIYLLDFCVFVILFWHLMKINSNHTHTNTESKSQRSISTIQIHFSLRQTSLMLWFVCGMVDFNTESFVSLFVCCYCAFFSSWSQIIGIYFQANKKSLMQCSIISHTHTKTHLSFALFSLVKISMIPAIALLVWCWAKKKEKNFIIQSESFVNWSKQTNQNVERFSAPVVDFAWSYRQITEQKTHEN